jgi:hypothetical protein
MANYDAIHALATALSAVLTNQNADEKLFDNTDFKPVRMSQLTAKPFPKSGVSVCLYRIAFSTTRRNLPPRRDVSSGQRFRPPTPVDLHFLVTAWAEGWDTQQQLLGWTIRTLHDTPVLPAGLINSYANANVFHPDEAVELVGESLTPAEMASIWEVAKNNQQPSVSFLARMVLIDSELALPADKLVQTRVLDGRELIPPS